MNSGPRMLLLLIDADSERAASVEAHLRHLGVAVHMTRCDHPAGLTADAPRFDLCVQALDGLHSLAGAGLPVLRDLGQDCPVLALGQPAFDCSLGAILAHGFSDWVGTDDPLHLRESARRELATVQSRRQTTALRAALLDSERRVEQIMHNTRDAHAVVIDGVHANANNPYLRLLALDPERATATPFLDCVAPEQQDDLKAVLRRFARGEISEHTQGVGYLQRTGTPVTVPTRFTPWIGDGERGVLVSPQTTSTTKAARPVAPARHPNAETAGELPEPRESAESADTPEAATDSETTRIEPLKTAPGQAQALTVTPGTAGGLAAEIELADNTSASSGGLSEQTVAPTASLTVADVRKRLRQSIRQNLLTLSLTPLQSLDSASPHYLAQVDPGKLLEHVETDSELRRLAHRVDLGAALDRWQLFVASRQAVQRVSRRSSTSIDNAEPTTLHVALCDGALTDETLVNWLEQLAGQYPQLRHTLWLPLSAARRSANATHRFRDSLSEIGMRLCLSHAFQHAGDLPDLRALAPHDVCLHSGVLDALAEGKFSAENVQRLTSLLSSQHINSFCLQAHDKLDAATAARLGFCLIDSTPEEESLETGV